MEIECWKVSAANRVFVARHMLQSVWVFKVAEEEKGYTHEHINTSDGITSWAKGIGSRGGPPPTPIHIVERTAKTFL